MYMALSPARLSVLKTVEVVPSRRVAVISGVNSSELYSTGLLNFVEGGGDALKENTVPFTGFL
ncbi:Uncharacterised protein [uncultured archaeon]|nr:Uncharacterised protein [uncultured archaeon]